MIIPRIKLSDENYIPQIGLGLWKVTDSSTFQSVFTSALAAGYSHFDSAQAYNNEQLLGDAIKDSGVKRDSLFITTKIAVQNFGDKKSRRSFMESLKRLDMDYVDLVLLHFPVPMLRKKTWQVVEALKAEGLARSIGVSNFTVSHLKQLNSYAKELPAVNQVEMHVFLQQEALRAYCKEKNIVVEAYSPLAHAKATDNAVIEALAQKHHKSYAQIMLRWAIQQDVVILPKSANPNRIKENLNILDFSLDEDEMQALKQQNRNMHTCWNPELVP